MRFNGRPTSDATALAALVAADGATGGFVKDSDFGAWTSFTHGLVAGAGTITTVGTTTARYKQVGKLVCVEYTLRITTNGTGSSYLQVALPFAAYAGGAIIGREKGSTGKSVVFAFSANDLVAVGNFYDNTYPGANGMHIEMSGVYEST